MTCEDRRITHGQLMYMIVFSLSLMYMYMCSCRRLLMHNAVVKLHLLNI